ncbi:2530_t:CDS:2 [Ambispora leptoticha]|uniref:2530_t:CDS:1 n=1 Tax=Ambispora leptoticha TaxID=144679 RepID=A0A9N9ARC3_9GLOM|nr:2530_t:CDS:2 [Ambispora leptoticha]
MATHLWAKSGFISELPPTPTSPFTKFAFNEDDDATNHNNNINKIYGICPECDSPNSGYGWCGQCINHSYQQTYPDRTSGNDPIDTFITKSQIVSTSQYNFFEWIPYSYFSDIEFLAEGGYGCIHTAVWLEGPISQYDSNVNQFLRDGAKKVALKTFKDSQNISAEFFDEIAGSLRHTFRYPIIPCYGMTQNPETLEFAMVVHYAADGNLREYMRKNNASITWQQKLDILHEIARGLSIIHLHGYTHHNFHIRPAAAVLERTLQRWYSDVKEDEVEKESCMQFKNAEENRAKEIPETIIHPGAIYQSKFLNLPVIAIENSQLDIEAQGF